MKGKMYKMVRPIMMWFDTNKRTEWAAVGRDKDVQIFIGREGPNLAALEMRISRNSIPDKNCNDVVMEEEKKKNTRSMDEGNENMQTVGVREADGLLLQSLESRQMSKYIYKSIDVSIHILLLLSCLVLLQNQKSNHR